MSGEYVNNVKNFMQLLPTRNKIIEEMPDTLDTSDPVADLAKRLHPHQLYLTIKEVKLEDEDIRTFKLIPKENSPTEELPPFKPGQYLSIKAIINGSPTSRAYTLASTPQDALKDKYYALTIKKREGGFFTDYIWNNWNVGTEVIAAPPAGYFGYNKLRDTKELVGLCGGSGVIPMRSMMRNIVQKDLDLRFTLFYGINSEKNILFKEEFKELEDQSKGRIKIVYVYSGDSETWDGERGFINSDIIQKYVDVQEKTFFICGPSGMYKHLDEELPKLNINNRRIRREVYSDLNDIIIFSDYPSYVKDKEFNITVNFGKGYKSIPAKANETILVAIERAGIICSSLCRSGECGFCRSKLIEGKVYINEDSDGRRIGDIKYGYIHPCASYPLSDLEIELPKSNM